MIFLPKGAAVEVLMNLRTIKEVASTVAESGSRYQQYLDLKHPYDKAEKGCKLLLGWQRKSCSRVDLGILRISPDDRTD